MRFRTAAILSVVLVGGMFVAPIAMRHVALAYLAQGVKTIPPYQRIFFGIGAFCASFRVVLAIPILAILFTIATFTNQAHPRA